MNHYQFFQASTLATRSGTDTSSSLSSTSSNRTIRAKPPDEIPPSLSRQAEGIRRILPATPVRDVQLHDLIALAGTAEPVSSIGQENFGHHAGHLADTICRQPYTVIGQGATFIAKRIHVDCTCNHSPFVVVKSPRITSRTEHVGQGIQKRLKHILFELRVLTHEALVGHENIVRFLGITWEDDYYDYNIKWPALLLEYADAGTLETAIGNNEIPEKQRLGLCFDVASGLNALHECGIIHCDIKPGNVLLFTDKSREIVAKLADFGLSLADSGKDARLPGGTPGWTAPEWETEIPADLLTKADVYSFGLLVWSVMTMTNDPFQAIGMPNPANLRQIQTLKESDKSMLVKVIAHMTKACPPASFSTARGVIIKTIRTDPKERDLSGAIVVLQQGLPDKDPRVRADVNPDAASILSSCRSLLNTTKSIARNGPLTEEHIWLACNFALRFTGISNRELNELKRKHNNKIDEAFFESYCELAIRPKNQQKLLQRRVDEIRVLSKAACGKWNQASFNANLEAVDVSKFSATHIRRLHPDIQNMVLDSLLKSAAAGSADSALYLSIFFTNVRFNPSKACEYLLQAAKLGSSSGMYLCHRIHRAHGIPINVSEPQRMSWFHTGICWGSQIAYQQAKEDDPGALWGANIILEQQGSRFGDLPFRDAESEGLFDLLHDDMNKIMSTIQSLKQSVDNITIAGENGDKLLHWVAAIHGTPFQQHKDILPKLLSEAKADPNVRNAKGETPLLAAAKAGNGSALAELLRAGADPTIASDTGQVPLHWLWVLPEYGIGNTANEDTGLALLAKILCQGKANSPGNTLHAVADALAVRLRGSGEPDQVERLQTYILSEMPAGIPLHWAVQRRSIPAIKALLAIGAKPSAKAYGADTRGTAQVVPLSAAHLAAGMHDNDILELFIRAEPGCLENLHPCPLAMAIDGDICCGYANGTFERMVRHGPKYRERAQKTFQFFWDQGFSSLRSGFTNTVDNGLMKKPVTPLLLGVQSGRADVVESLLETPYKKDIGLKCGSGNFDPLQESIKQGCEEVYFALRRHGADPLSTALLDDGRRNNLSMLCEFGTSSLKVAKDLIDAGVSVSAGDLFNYAPLRDALRKGFFSHARLFLDNGADPNELRGDSGIVHHLDENIIEFPTSILGSLIANMARHKILPLTWLLDQHTAGSLPIPLKATVCPKTGFNIFHQLGFSAEKGREEGISADAFHKLRNAFPDPLLLNATANVEESTAMGDKKITPLFMAINSFDLALVKAMLAAGADPAVDLGNGLTVLDLAKEHTEEFELCLRRREFPSRLMPSNIADLPKMLAKRKEIVRRVEEKMPKQTQELRTKRVRTLLGRMAL